MVCKYCSETKNFRLDTPQWGEGKLDGYILNLNELYLLHNDNKVFCYSCDRWTELIEFRDYMNW